MPLPTLLQIGMLEQPPRPDVRPIDYVVERVMKDLHLPPAAPNPFANRLMILEAKTASGKSITVPPQVYIAMQGVQKLAMKSVLCTQPRILTAIEIPKEIARENYFADLGFQFRMRENLGYQTGPQAQTVRRGLIYATLGVLEQKLKCEMDNPDRICRAYSAIIIDEAHERALIFDTTIAILKQFYLRNAHRDDLPYLIFMSATFDVAKYAAFFDVPSDATSPNVIRVAGASHPIETRWAQSTVGNIYDGIVERVKEIINNELVKERFEAGATVVSKNRIIVFVPGVADSKHVKAGLAATKLTDRDGVVMKVPGTEVAVRVVVECLYVDSDAMKKASNDYVRLFGGDDAAVRENLPRFEMLVFTTTALSETGLSLDDLGYCIDTGLSKESEFCPTENITSMLLSRPAAQSRITQRKGRVGRKKPGVFYPLYTEETFAALPRDQTPEVLKTDPTNLILSIIAFTGHLATASELAAQLLDVPTKPAMRYALHKLQLLGFIDAKYAITPSGLIASKITNTLRVESIGAILAAFAWDASVDDLAAIAAMVKFSYGSKSFWGWSRVVQDELKKQGKRDELQRRAPLPVDRERLYNTILAGGYSGAAEPDECEGWWGGAEEAPRGTLKRSLYYPVRAIVADDMIEKLFILRAMERKYEEVASLATPSARYDKLSKWAASCFLNLDVLLEAYNDYIAVKSALALAEIDITWGRDADFVRLMRADSEAAGGVLSDRSSDVLTRLKLCLYHGYKMNLCTLVEPGKYRIGYGGREFAWSFFEGDHVWKKYDAPYTYAPKRVLFVQTDVMMMLGRYRFMVNGISVLDGFL